jgi:hypothetical protein
VKQTRLDINNEPLPTSTVPSLSSPVLESAPTNKSIAEVGVVKAEEVKTSECVEVTAATVGRCSSKGGVRKRTMRWSKWYKRKREKELVQAALEVLNAVRHDTSQLMVVSAVIDGRWCKDVLIDPGASASFVRQDWANGVVLPMKKLNTPLDVALAHGEVVARLTHAVTPR